MPYGDDIEQRHALDYALRNAFAHAVAEARDDPSVKAECCSAVVLTNAGGHFCAGRDIKAMADRQNQTCVIFEGRERIR